MRITLKTPGWVGNADLTEQIENSRPRCFSGKTLMQRQNFSDLLLDRVQRIERGHRLLKDDRDVVATHMSVHHSVGLPPPLAVS